MIPFGKFMTSYLQNKTKSSFDFFGHLVSLFISPFLHYLYVFTSVQQLKLTNLFSSIINFSEVFDTAVPSLGFCNTDLSQFSVFFFSLFSILVHSILFHFNLIQFNPVYIPENYIIMWLTTVMC